MQDTYTIVVLGNKIHLMFAGLNESNAQEVVKKYLSLNEHAVFIYKNGQFYNTNVQSWDLFD